MKLTIDLKEVMKYMSDDLLYEAFLEVSSRSDEETLEAMQKQIIGCMAFNSPNKKK